MRVQARNQIEETETRGRYDDNQGGWRKKILSYEDLLKMKRIWENPAFRNQYEFRDFYTPDGHHHYYELFQKNDGTVNMGIDNTDIQIGSEKLSSQEQLDEERWDKGDVPVSDLIQNARDAMNLDDPGRTGKAPGGHIEYVSDKGDIRLNLNSNYVWEPGSIFSTKFTSAKTVNDELEKVYGNQASSIRYENISKEKIEKTAEAIVSDIDELKEAAADTVKEIEGAEKKGKDTRQVRRGFKTYVRGAFDRWKDGKGVKERILGGMGKIRDAFKHPEQEELTPEQQMDKAVIEMTTYYNHRLRHEQAKLGKLKGKEAGLLHTLNNMEAQIRELKAQLPTKENKEKLKGLEGRRDSMLSEWKMAQEDTKSQEELYRRLQAGQERNTAYFNVYKNFSGPVKEKEKLETDKAVAMVNQIQNALAMGQASAVIGNVIHQGKLHLIVGRRERDEEGKLRRHVYVDGHELTDMTQLYGLLAAKGGHAYPDYKEELKAAEKYLAGQKPEQVGWGKAFPGKVSIVTPSGKTISAFAREADPDSKGNPTIKWDYMLLGKHISEAEVKAMFNGEREDFEKMLRLSGNLTKEGAKEVQEFLKERGNSTRSMDILRANFIDYNRANMNDDTRQDRIVIFAQDGVFHSAQFDSNAESPSSFTIDGKKVNLLSLTSAEKFMNLMSRSPEEGNIKPVSLDLEKLERIVMDKSLSGKGSPSMVVKIPAGSEPGSGIDSVKISLREGSLSYQINNREADRAEMSKLFSSFNEMAKEQGEQAREEKEVQQDKETVKAVKEADRADERKEEHTEPVREPVSTPDKNIQPDTSAAAKEDVPVQKQEDTTTRAQEAENPAVDQQPVFYTEPSGKDEQAEDGYYEHMANGYRNQPEITAVQEPQQNPAAYKEEQKRRPEIKPIPEFLKTRGAGQESQQASAVIDFSEPDGDEDEDYSFLDRKNNGRQDRAVSKTVSYEEYSGVKTGSIWDKMNLDFGDAGQGTSNNAEKKDPFMDGFSIDNTGRNSSNTALMAYQINCEYFGEKDPSFTQGDIYEDASKPFITTDRFGQPEHEFRKYKDESGQWKITDVSESSHGPFVKEMNMDQFRALIGKMTTPGNQLYSKRAAMDIQRQLTAGSRQTDFIKEHEKDPLLKGFAAVKEGHGAEIREHNVVTEERAVI